ncbi:unnamed protein product [Phytophthora fragariaefolia]|uniref:Unnamed protein product n=1 Tax=Phytophthora fragariaefolia TaxID=1490495 RepID=A0A9W6WWR8_9STRA|nr:unnamed protein product [Phytophthora fragariaefolia]
MLHNIGGGECCTNVTSEKQTQTSYFPDVCPVLHERLIDFTPRTLDLVSQSNPRVTALIENERLVVDLRYFSLILLEVCRHPVLEGERLAPSSGDVLVEITGNPDVSDGHQARGQWVICSVGKRQLVPCHATMVRDAGTDGPVGTVPLFTPILPPMIESVSHEALVKWKRDRRDYETKMKARCRMTGKAYDVVVQSVKDSFESNLLDVFCELQCNSNSTDVTEGILVADIDHIVGSIKNDSLPDIEKLFKAELRMNMSDVNARLMDYYKNFKAIVEDNGLTEVFAGENGPKQKCKMLIASLMPKSLKAEVKQCVRFTHGTAAKNPKQLFDLILEKASELERQHQRRKSTCREPARADKDKPKAEPAKKQKQRWESKRPAKADPSPSVGSNSSKKEPKEKAARSSKPPPGPCPNGSDYTVIGRSHWDMLHGIDPSVQAEALDVPIVNQTFGSLTVTARQKAKLHVRIHTAVGPVELMNAVDVLIMDGNDNEFIIGNNLLTSLGIDVGRQLEQLATRSDDETSGDPIDLEADEMPVQLDGSAPSGDSDIFAALES